MVPDTLVWTPTLADNRTLAVDIRRQADAVPLGFVIDDRYRVAVWIQYGLERRMLPLRHTDG